LKGEKGQKKEKIATKTLLTKPLIFGRVEKTIADILACLLD
jgi:hypothetical protein